MNPQERYDFHNRRFNKWLEKVFWPARHLFYEGNLSSEEFAVLQRKKARLLKCIDLAEKAL
jgi:hypothetical protein